MEIDAKTVMALRNKTGLSMMECKKALQEAGGDPEAAEDILRKKMKGKMDTRTDRAAGEGRIAIALANDGRAGAIVEVRAETDFTARNDKFIAAAQKIAELALAHNQAGDAPLTPDMTKLIDDLRISTGENISYARGHKLQGGPAAQFSHYVHHDGKTGVLLHGEGDVTSENGRDICMHITAATPRPQGVTREDVPASVIEKERRLAIEMAVEAGKPQEIAEKMVEGKINKLYSDLALLEQEFIRDPTKKVKDLLPKGATVKKFLRWQVGGE